MFRRSGDIRDHVSVKAVTCHIDGSDRIDVGYVRPLPARAFLPVGGYWCLRDQTGFRCHRPLSLL